MNKKTILLLSDHPLSTSGVGTQTRWLINGLVNTGKYSFRCFGAAVKHDNYDTISVNQDFIIKPTDGFGDKNLLRKTLAQVRPDILLLFTDPRFFYWVWEMADEIKQICPIAYWHLWDNPPWPDYNNVLYQSTDLINCINYPTYEMVHERFPEKTNYIPHSVPQELFKELPQQQVEDFKKKLLGKDRLDHFTVLYVSRNARRKMTADILKSWQMFMKDLKEKHGHQKVSIIMHCDPLDPEGTNLYSVIDMLGIKESVVFSKDRIAFEEMNLLYNMCDTIVNRSSNEGFGLPILEAKMCGKPVIAIKTGGLTRQVEDHITGEHYGIGLEPEVRSMVGNLMIPYIYEDFISHETLSKSFMEIYDWGPEKRREVGQKAMKHAHRDYIMENVINDWDVSLTKLTDTWQNPETKPAQWEMKVLDV